jgi:CheY-like chemotaxis protein
VDLLQKRRTSLHLEADALRAHLDTDVQAFATTLTVVENNVQEMQAATRGYILTQQPAFLEQYHTAQDGLPARLQDLGQLGPRVDETLEMPIAEFVQTVERWQREGSDRQIAMVQQGRTANAVAEVAAGQSQVLFDSIRGRVNDLQEQAQANQTALIAQINRARTLQSAITNGLAVLGLIAVGFVLLGFRGLMTAQENDTVTIGVRDQGPGVPAAERERIFERFYQLEQPSTRNVGGSGLGLAICKAIVEAHGGRIWVAEAPGGGADFVFSLPAMPVAETHAVRPGPNVLVQPRSGATHVLVVDDDPAMRRLLETSLPDAGYQVHTVVEAQAALEHVIQHQPDVILLDVMLPGMDGFTLCKQLREWTKVPIIMLTARAAERDVVLGLQLGADDYVTKPFRANELIARIDAVLRRAQPESTSGGPSLIQVDGLTIDLAQRSVTVDGAEVASRRSSIRSLPIWHGILARC